MNRIIIAALALIFSQANVFAASRAYPPAPYPTVTWASVPETTISADELSPDNFATYIAALFEKGFLFSAQQIQLIIALETTPPEFFPSLKKELWSLLSKNFYYLATRKMPRSRDLNPATKPAVVLACLNFHESKKFLSAALNSSVYALARNLGNYDDPEFFSQLLTAFYQSCVKKDHSALVVFCDDTRWNRRTSSLRSSSSTPEPCDEITVRTQITDLHSFGFLTSAQVTRVVSILEMTCKYPHVALETAYFLANTFCLHKLNPEAKELSPEQLLAQTMRVHLNNIDAFKPMDGNWWYNWAMTTPSLLEQIEEEFYPVLLRKLGEIASSSLPLPASPSSQEVELLDTARNTLSRLSSVTISHSKPDTISPRHESTPSPFAMSRATKPFHPTAAASSPTLHPIAVSYDHASYVAPVMKSPVEIFILHIRDLCRDKIISDHMYLHFRAAVTLMASSTCLQILRGELAQTLEQIRSTPAILHNPHIHFDYSVNLYQSYYSALVPYLDAFKSAIFLCSEDQLNALKSMFYETLSYYLNTRSIYTNPELPRLLVEINAHAAVPHKTAPTRK
jgi:hypothetical protein